MNEGAMAVEIFRIIVSAAMTILLTAIGYIGKVVRDIRSDVRRQNGRIGKIEEWRIGHEKLSDERHMAILENAREVWVSINKIKDHLLNNKNHR